MPTAGPSAQQERELGAQFDQLAGQVTALFNRIQAQAVITAADYAQANAALGQLAAMAQLPIEYITRQWNSAAYRPAYEQRLTQIRDAAIASGAPGVSVVTPGATNGGGSAVTPDVLASADDNSGLLILAGAALLVVFLMKR